MEKVKSACKALEAIEKVFKSIKTHKEAPS